MSAQLQMCYQTITSEIYYQTWTHIGTNPLWIKYVDQSGGNLYQWFISKFHTRYCDFFFSFLRLDWADTWLTWVNDAMLRKPQTRNNKQLVYWWSEQTPDFHTDCLRARKGIQWARSAENRTLLQEKKPASIVCARVSTKIHGVTPIIGCWWIKKARCARWTRICGYMEEAVFGATTKTWYTTRWLVSFYTNLLNRHRFSKEWRRSTSAIT